MWSCQGQRPHSHGEETPLIWGRWGSRGSLFTCLEPEAGEGCGAPRGDGEGKVLELQRGEVDEGG